MVQPLCLFLFLALFIGGECFHKPLQLKKHETKEKSNTDTNDLLRPRRTIYGIGAGDNYMMTKLSETNSRLSTIEGTLFRIENTLNLLQAGGAIPLMHAASIIKTPINGGHISAANSGAALNSDAPASRSAAFSGGYPAQNLMNALTHGNMPHAGMHQHPRAQGMHQGLQPPQFQHNFLPQPQHFQPQPQPQHLQPPQFQHNFQSQPQPQPPPPQGKGAADISSKPRKVSWMDSVCSEPCGIANGPRKVRSISSHTTGVRHIRDAMRFIRETGGAAVTAAPASANDINGTATGSAAASAAVSAAPAPAPAATADAAKNGSTPSNDDPDPIEVNQMRVVGGEESMKHKYPWQVYIQIYLSVGGVARCGGSIINDRYVVTAGHCTYTGDRACAIKVKPEAITVTVAEHNINSINDDIRGATDRIDVRRIIRHPKYCASDIEMDNDVALLRLAEVLVLPDIEEIGHICLPGGPLDSFSGMTATVAGWGYKEEDFDERDHTDLAGKLQEVDFKIHPDCSSYPNPEDITDNMICAGDEKNTKDACGGDSGGPLMIQKDGQYTLAGLVSFGPEGGDCTGEGVYVKLANYIQWIRENTMDAGC